MGEKETDADVAARSGTLNVSASPGGSVPALQTAGSPADAGTAAPAASAQTNPNFKDPGQAGEMPPA